ncbi:MAG: hypothetical protein V2B18_17645 [Pseudomonadota bacterium]
MKTAPRAGRFSAGLVPFHLWRVVASLCLVWLCPHTAVAEFVEKAPGGSSWEMPGRLSIYDLQFGPAALKGEKMEFQGNIRKIHANRFQDRLTLMVRFSYNASRPDVSLKFVVKLPDSRPYEETVQLTKRQGQYTYTFTIHKPEEFVGSASVYLYYGFSIVDVLDFTIFSGT